MNRFELLTDPLTPGVAVIEASAGTGKTFALAGLVLRLLLEPDGAAPPPGIDQLLVVTYTNAATDELRERIRARLRSATDAFERGATDDALEQSLLTRFAGADERAQAGQRLIRRPRLRRCFGWSWHRRGSAALRSLAAVARC